MTTLPEAQPQGQASHTPGPWTAYNHDVVGPDHGGIASTNPNRIAGNVLNYATARANARLISAAPDLLAACEDLLMAHIGGVWTCECCGEPMDRQSPYSQGEHGSGCPIPGVLAAVKKARAS